MRRASRSRFRRERETGWPGYGSTSPHFPATTSFAAEASDSPTSSARSSTSARSPDRRSCTGTAGVLRLARARQGPGRLLVPRTSTGRGARRSKIPPTGRCVRGGPAPRTGRSAPRDHDGEVHPPSDDHGSPPHRGRDVVAPRRMTNFRLMPPISSGVSLKFGGADVRTSAARGRASSSQDDPRWEGRGTGK